MLFCTFAALVLLLPPPPTAPPRPYDDSESGTREEALALIAAMDINDGALRSLEWSQKNERATPDGWEVAEQSERVFDGARWACDRTVSLPAADGRSVNISSNYVFDGLVLHTLDKARKTGLVRESKPADVAMWSTPLKFMGRFVDTVEHRSLAEVLEGAAELRVRAGASEGVRVVSGYVELGQHAYFLQADIDTSRGFAPVRIALYDGLVRRPVEVLEVTRLGQHAGAWIPVSGVDSLYTLPSEMSDPRWSKLQEKMRPLVSEDGTIHAGEAAIRQAAKSAINEVYGAGGVPVELLSPPHRLTVTVRSANERIPDARFRLSPPDGAVIVDGLHLRASNGSPVVISP